MPTKSRGLIRARVRASAGRAQEYEVKKIWAKRWINEAVFNLVQWAGYMGLMQGHIPWKTVSAKILTPSGRPVLASSGGA